MTESSVVLNFCLLKGFRKTIDAIEGMSSSIAKGVAEGVQGIAGNELRSLRMK